MKDGTILSKDSTPESGTVAAVIVREATVNGKPALGVGIYRKYSIPWCNTTAEGCNKAIKELEGTEISGHMNGSNGWSVVESVYSDAAEHPEYYPAWNYSLTYAAKYGLTGDLAKGWYLPKIAELNTIYHNKTIINRSIKKAGGDEFDAGSKYWSSTHFENDVWVLLVGTYKIINEQKNLINNYYACTVKAFN